MATQLRVACALLEIGLEGMHGMAGSDDAGTRLLSLISEVDRASIVLMGQRAPEVRDACAVIDSLRDPVASLAAQLRAIGSACHDFAHHLDEAHSHILDAIADFMKETAADVAVGVVVGILSAGIGIGLSAAAETRIAKAAADAIRAIVDILEARAVLVAAEMDLAATRVAAITDAAPSRPPPTPARSVPPSPPSPLSRGWRPKLTPVRWPRR